LGRLGVASARPILEAAGSYTANTVWRAGEALESIGPGVVPILREALSSPTPATRQLAAPGLSKMSREPDAETVPGMVEALRSPDATFRARAIDAINRFGPAAADALPALLEFLEAEGTPAHEQSMVAYTFGRLGPAAESAVPALLAAITRHHGYFA